jgi:tetratricopeptide (TPR) repeat protein
MTDSFAPSLSHPDAVDPWLRALEQRPASPVAALVAAAEMDDRLPATALRRLEELLDTHPDHATAWLIAAKVCITLRRYADARRALEQVLLLAPSSVVALLLQREMQELELRYPPPVHSMAVPLAAAEPPLAPRGRQKRARWSWDRQLIGETPVAAPRRESPTPSPSTRPLDLDRLAHELEQASIPVVPDDEARSAAAEPPIPVDLHTRAVTETLASIYVRQGRIREAIDAYRELRHMHPERTYEFTLLILELEQALQASTDGDSPR